MEADSVIEHSVPTDGNVVLALGFEPGEAANLRIRADLMMAVEEVIRMHRLKQREAARLFGVSQPRISDLLRGKSESFTIDSLVNMLGHAGMRVRVMVDTAPQETAAAREWHDAQRA